MLRIGRDAPSLHQARDLLAEAGLPTDDLAEDPRLRLFGLQDGDRLVGVVGVQPLDGAVLLRSLAVAAKARGRGAGALLVAAVEDHARQSGSRDVYLLTTDAAAYFERRGYQRVSRDEAPASLRATRQFAQLCPASAAVMHKRLG
jgi:N-acetylglutamate synthase-like GNAT family acetyltransferase